MGDGRNQPLFRGLKPTAIMFMILTESARAYMKIIQRIKPALIIHK